MFDIKAILGSLCYACVLLMLDNSTNPEQDVLVFGIIFFFIHTLDYFPAIPHELFIFDAVIITIRIECLDNIL